MLRDSNFFPSHFSFFVSNFNGRRWMQELRNVIWWNMRSSWIFKSKIQHSFKKLPFCMIKITFLLIPFSFCIEAKHSSSPTPHPPHPHTPSSAKDCTFITLETLITSLVIMEIGALNPASVSYAREKCCWEISSFSRILEI